MSELILKKADGTNVSAGADSFGNLNDTLATKLDPTNDGITTFANGNFITTITTATTTLVMAFPGVVLDVNVIGGTLGNVTIYDSLTATGTVVIPAVSPDKGQSLIRSATTFAIGCTVVTAAATIMTVTWRAS